MSKMIKDNSQKLVPRLRFPEFQGDVEWKEKRLGELLSVGNGRDHKHIPEGDIPVYGSGGYMRSVNDYLYEGDSVCIGRKGTIDKPFLLTGKFWAVDTLFYTYSFRNCLPSFVYLLFQNIEWKKHNEAGGIPSLSKTNIEKILVAIPSSTDEQHKIAGCLSSLDDLITAQEGMIAVLKTKKKGLTQKLFPGEGELEPRLRLAVSGEMGDWVVKSFYGLLDDIIDFRGRTPKKLGMDWGGGDVISLSANNVKDGYIDLAAECNLGSQVLYEKWMGGVNLEKGDIVFTMEAPLGKALRVPDSRKYILSQRVVAFKTKRGVNNSFLLQLIWSERFQSELEKLSTGSAAKGINQKTLATVNVLMPNNDEEQEKIANCLASIDELVAAHTNKLDALKIHRKGLLQQLFAARGATGA